MYAEYPTEPDRRIILASSMGEFSGSYSTDILMTIRDGKLFKGTSMYSSDVIANVKDGKVYSGTSSYNSDIEFSFDGNLTIEEFVAVWHAVKYSW